MICSYKAIYEVCLCHIHTSNHATKQELFGDYSVLTWWMFGKPEYFVSLVSINYSFLWGSKFQTNLKILDSLCSPHHFHLIFLSELTFRGQISLDPKIGELFLQLLIKHNHFLWYANLLRVGHTKPKTASNF